MNCVCIVEKDGWEIESWTERGEPGELTREFAGWHDDVHIMIDAAPRLLKWAYLTRKELKRYAYGRAALLGDACHPTLPFLAQGAVMALEDGVVLARCLEKYEDVPEALRAYERARLERDNAMVRGATEMTSHFHNPDYRDPVKADAYISREWSGDSVARRYDWLFTYNCDTAPV